MIVAPMLDSAFMPVGALRFRIVCKFVDGAGSLWACLGISQIAFPYQRFHFSRYDFVYFWFECSPYVTLVAFRVFFFVISSVPMFAKLQYPCTGSPPRLLQGYEVTIHSQCLTWVKFPDVSYWTSLKSLSSLLQ